MKIIYARDRTLEQRIDTLTYRELRGMLPEIIDEDSIPRPELLKDNCRSRFLEVEEEDFSVRLYCDGVCLYQEGDKGSSFAVSQCAALEFPSVSDDYAATVQADEMHWLLPLVVTGQERVFHDQDSEEGYHTLHFEAGLPAELTPHTPNFVVEVSAEEIEEAERAGYRRRLRKLHDELARVMRCMTERQKQVFLLRYQSCMKTERIAARLGICRSAAFAHLHKANEKVDRYLPR